MIHASSSVRRLLPTLVMLVVIAGCARPTAEEAPADDESPTAGDYQLCRDPRPEVCTREYRPVCADRVGEDGRAEQVTRPNACEACSDPEVRGHRPGACAATTEEPAAGRTRIDDAY